MRRIITRLIIIGIFAGIGWVGYQLADFTTCEGPRAEAWLDASMDRFEDSEIDYYSWNDYTTLNQFSLLAEHARERYHAQLNQETIACLEDLNDHNADFYWYEWKMYEAASKDDFLLAAQYDDDRFQSLEAMMRELDRMAAKYNWDLD